MKPKSFCFKHVEAVNPAANISQNVSIGNTNERLDHFVAAGGEVAGSDKNCASELSLFHTLCGWHVCLAA